MSVEERASATEHVLAARERYVARGVSTPSLVVSRAAGARLWDADGREFLDFAGGIGCQNLGHGPSAVVAAIHEQVDRYLHQCFMVGVYEPYVEVCRRLDELWPGEAPTKSPPPELGRRGGRERGQDRPRRHGAARRRRLRPRLPRPHELLTHGDDGEGRLQAELRPVRPRGVPRARALPVPRRHDRGRDRRRWSACSGGRRSRARSRASCSSRCRARAASSRCRPSSCTRSAASATSTGSSTSTTRCRRARPHGHHVGDRALRRRAGPARLGQVARRRAAARRGHRQGGADGCRPPGRARRHLRRQPGRLRSGTRGARPARPHPASASGRSRSAASVRSRLEEIASRRSLVGEVRGLGAMLALELLERTPDAAKANDCSRLREGPAPAVVRPVRERDPAPAAAHGDGRGARARPRPAGGSSWRRWRRARLTPSRSPRRRRSGSAASGARTAASSPSPASTSTSAPASSSRCSGPPAPARRRRLRLIAGFERPDAGRVELSGGTSRGSPPYARAVNTVFQDYALFPHMTVAENVEYGLRGEGSLPARAAASGEEALLDACVCEGSATASRHSSRAASGSASRSRARSSTGRACCSSTSRSARST